MIRTQVQLPEPLYQQVRALAERQDWSLAEAIRRGAELLVNSFPREATAPGTWSLPEALPLGEFSAPVDSWRELAQERDP